MFQRIKSAIVRRLKNRLRPHVPRVRRLVAVLMPHPVQPQVAATTAHIHEELLVELDDLIRETTRLQVQVAALQDTTIERLDRMEIELRGGHHVRAAG